MTSFQKNSPHQAVDFPPGSCWLVFTDQVLHAALGGEFALEQTFHLDVAQMARAGARADPGAGTVEREERWPKRGARHGAARLCA